MKGLRILLTIAFVVTSLLVSALGVSADDWTSGIMVQNQSLTESAEIDIDFYWAEGQASSGLAYTHHDTLTPGQAMAYSVSGFTGLPEGFVGSAVVRSTTEIAANLNTQVPKPAGAQYFAGETPDYPNRMGTASGVLTDEAYNNLYFTQVLKNIGTWGSYVAIQNTSPSDNAEVTVKYFEGGSGAEITAAREMVTVSPNTTYISRQSDNANLGASFFGSIAVESTQPVAGIANFYDDGSDPAHAKFHSYNGAGAGATTLYAPRIVTEYATLNGGIQIQNIGSAATDVTLTFTFDTDNNGVTEDYEHVLTGIEPGASGTVFMGATSRPATIPAGFQGAGSVEMVSTGQPIIATINESSDTLGWGTTYNALPAGSGSSTILFPQVTSRLIGLSGGVQIFNESGTDAPVIITCSYGGTVDLEITDRVVPAGASIMLYLPTEGVTPGFNGSVTVVATGGQSLMGIANFAYQQGTYPEDGWAPNYGDSYVTYNAIIQ